MRLHIVSWNVNGLHMNGIHGPRKLLLRQELSSHFLGDVDVLFAQEHKLSMVHSHRCGKLLPGASHTFWEPAIGECLVVVGFAYPLVAAISLIFSSMAL